MTKQSFLKGAMILLAAGIINRLLGFVPRIALPRIIGAEGVGIFQLSYPFLSVLLTLITGGIPLAVAKWIAEADSKGDSFRIKHIFRTAMLLTTSIAAVMTILLLLFAPWITTHLLPDKRVLNSFLCMAPMLLIIAVSSVFRGYYQGKQNMIPTASSQVVETILRIACQLTFAYYFLPMGLEWAAAGSMLGVLVGEIAGLAVMLFTFAGERKKAAEASRNEPAAKGEPVLGKLLQLSVPVTASRLVGSLSYLLESIFTARSLAAAGIATGIATAQYGALQGMIIPLVLLPTALTYSLAVSLVPSLSEAAAKGDKDTIHNQLNQSMRLALITGAPFVVVMTLFAEPICRMLYDHSDIAPLLAWMAPVGLFIYLQAPLQAALQALDKPGTALMNTFIGAAVKLFLIVTLASDPNLGIKGALIAINVNIVLVTLLHAISVQLAIGFRLKLLDFIKIGAAMTIMGGAAQFTMNHNMLPKEWGNLLAACAASVAVYLILLIWMRVINRYDMQRLPGIRRWFR
ncbi:stage V sporulation protein B [Paenibacillus protaetiae]|uniref:Stage V sporulation protein B n=1 Tax=Paenibacillus protaetiae TaxID=2509456 RepID=A0A4P6EQQ7_9BACL|nr:stage V sporulation protein B [Paenibacillus protaetiae]QAY65184.1 stage V sporulation protein B [Paenibacillus protaetiae]